MNTIVRLVYRNFRSTLDRVTLFFELIFPLFFIFIQGFAYTGIVPNFELGGQIITYPIFLAAGAVTLTVINGGTTAGQLLWFDRKNGMFEQILMGPFTRGQYIFSIIASTILIGITGATLVFLIALPVLGAVLHLTLVGFLYTATALILGSLFFGGMAIALSVVLKSSESFQVLSNLLFFVFLFTSSVFYPADKLPPALRTISYFNPLTFITDMFRTGLLNLNVPLLPYEATALIAVSLTMFVIAVFSFRKIKV